MPRIRTIKPEFFLDTDLAELSIQARYFFIGLWTQADREGRLEDNPKRLKAQIMPWDPCDPEKLLKDLSGHFIRRYKSGNGHYIQIVNFLKHQRPHLRESGSSIPPEKPSILNRAAKHNLGSAKAQPRRCSSTAKAMPSPLDKGNGYWILENGKGKECEGGVETSTPPSVDSISANSKKPDGRELTPIQYIVRAYKIAKNIDADDKPWDKANFKRCSKAAKSIADCFKNDAKSAVEYVIKKGDIFDEKKLDWTLETIARHAWDDRGKINTEENHDESTGVEMGANCVLGPKRSLGVTPSRELAGEALKALRPDGVHEPESPDMGGGFDDPFDG